MAQELVVTVKWVSIETREQNQSGSVDDTSINGPTFRDMSPIILTREDLLVLEAWGGMFG